jgi:hypothetical protein
MTAVGATQALGSGSFACREASAPTSVAARYTTSPSCRASVGWPEAGARLAIDRRSITQVQPKQAGHNGRTRLPASAEMSKAALSAPTISTIHRRSCEAWTEHPEGEPSPGLFLVAAVSAASGSGANQSRDH